jgi:hypothetical protein
MRRHLAHGLVSGVLLAALAITTAAPAVQLFGTGFVVKTYGKQINFS